MPVSDFAPTGGMSTFFEPRTIRSVTDRSNAARLIFGTVTVAVINRPRQTLTGCRRAADADYGMGSLCLIRFKGGHSKYKD